jgi:hypothetical protein
MAPVLKADDTRAKRVQTQALAFDDMEQMAVFDENQRLYGAFTKFDTNHDGQISLSEFERMLGTLRIKVSMGFVERIWATVDHDGSGELEWEEFKQMMQHPMYREALEEHGQRSKGGLIEWQEEPVTARSSARDVARWVMAMTDADDSALSYCRKERVNGEALLSYAEWDFEDVQDAFGLSAAKARMLYAAIRALAYGPAAEEGVPPSEASGMQTPRSPRRAPG